MKASDLNLRELLDFRGEGGVVHIGPLRVILMNPAALGLLRKELVDGFGWNGARMVLTRLGYTEGWWMAEHLAREVPWDSEAAWREAGHVLHQILGHAEVDASTPEQYVWRDSFEADQHLLHLGQATAPVCWMMTGFTTGYLSCAHGTEIFVKETKCRGKGDPMCQVVAKPRGEWGDAIDEEAAFYRSESLDAALQSIGRALKSTEEKLEQHVRRLRSTTEGYVDPSGTVAASEAMKKTLELARRLAKVDSSVLITGESGVGKERVARLIHDESERAGGPFVPVNCAAVTETLLESELFGHARGSFTGATHDRPGLFEAARRGTIFLDEIGEISPAMQVKLLRVLQEQEIRRVGENRPRKIDARVIAATNRDLGDDVLAGRFRDDLYYRLRVIELRIPPLRERRQDIMPIARRALGQLSRKMNRQMTAFTPAAADQLLRYAWPGNVRELQNAIEHAIVLADGERIDADDLPEEVRRSVAPPDALDLSMPLADVERRYILAVLEANEGNQARTAKQLGIGTATLYRKLRAYEKGSG